MLLVLIHPTWFSFSVATCIAISAIPLLTCTLGRICNLTRSLKNACPPKLMFALKVEGKDLSWLYWYAIDALIDWREGIRTGNGGPLELTDQVAYGSKFDKEVTRSVSPRVTEADTSNEEEDAVPLPEIAPDMESEVANGSRSVSDSTGPVVVNLGAASAIPHPMQNTQSKRWKWESDANILIQYACFDFTDVEIIVVGEWWYTSTTVGNTSTPAFCVIFSRSKKSGLNYCREQAWMRICGTGIFSSLLSHPHCPPQATGTTGIENEKPTSSHCIDWRKQKYNVIPVDWWLHDVIRTGNILLRMRRNRISSRKFTVK